ncbi:MAG: hypothetical protein L0Y75_05170, partial [Acidobacteria bacterium]|nr:hypothetical protein [Acidobacteriota bacterium]
MREVRFYRPDRTRRFNRPYGTRRIQPRMQAINDLPKIKPSLRDEENRGSYDVLSLTDQHPKLSSTKFNYGLIVVFGRWRPTRYL